MKTVYNNYDLETTGKVLEVSLQALFRATGIGGEITTGVVDASTLDALAVGLEVPGVTGVRMLSGVGASRYTVSEDKLTIMVANLPAGVSRVHVFGKYGTNACTMLVATLNVQQNVPFIDVAGTCTPLVRYATKDAEVDGVQYYAYAYKYGAVLVWFAAEALDYKHAVTAYMAEGLDAEFAEATEVTGRILNNASATVYDVKSDATIGIVDTLGGLGGGDATLVIGTEAERLAYEEPIEGMEFHQVSYDEAEDKYSVRRFIYENRAWVELESPQTEQNETVTLHVSTWDGLGTVEGLAVGVTDNTTQITLSRVLDHNGECTFEIVKGHTYTITVANLTGYHALPDETFRAANDERTITMVFQAEATNYETVIAHVTVYNKNLVDITNSDTDFIGMAVELQVDGEETPRAGVIGSDHQCVFTVEYGKQYSLTAPTMAGYRIRYEASKEFTHTAGVPQRELPMHYMEWVSEGIYGIDANGAYYDFDTIEAMTETEREAIIAVGLNSSRLQAANAGFCYALPTGATGKQWAASNVEFDQTILPFKQNHAAAVLDLNGAQNTQNIISIGDSMGVATPAADYCAAQTITFNGVTENGFLGAYGQMYALSENIAVLNALHTLLGASAPGFTGGYWWTSTQYNAGFAVYLNDGGFYGYTKAGSPTTVALFALP